MFILPFYFYFPSYSFSQSVIYLFFLSFFFFILIYWWLFFIALNYLHFCLFLIFLFKSLPISVYSSFPQNFGYHSLPQNLWILFCQYFLFPLVIDTYTYMFMAMKWERVRESLCSTHFLGWFMGQMGHIRAIESYTQPSSSLALINNRRKTIWRCNGK